MVEFLSDAWITRLDAAARAATGLVADPPFTVTTLVRAAGRDLGYEVHFTPDGASVTALGHTAPGQTGPGDGDVVLVTDPATAWALHQGAIRAQDAFAQGRLKVRGRPELLAAHAGLLVELERALAPERAGTTPPEQDAAR
jgi:hypothetical protein